MKKREKKAFTLIEILIVILIVWLVSFSTYIPYSYHQKKVYLQEWVKDISQGLTRARNIAIHWYANAWQNQRSYVEIVPGESELHIYTLSFDESDHSLKTLFSSIDLPRGVIVETVNGSKDMLTLIYDAISGELSFVSGNPWDTIEILLSYKWANNATLQKNIQYYTATHISDY